MQPVESGQLWLDKRSEGTRIFFVQSVTNFGYVNGISFNFACDTRRYTRIKLAGFHKNFRCLAH